MHCTNCGNPARAESLFCSKCGSALYANHQPIVMPQALSITFLEGEAILAERYITTDHDMMLRFGREIDNNIVVAPPSNTVSGHHGIIEVRGGYLYIVDTNSSNGLFHNGVRKERIQLGIGDVVSIGMPQRGTSRTVIVVGEADKRWNMFNLAKRNDVSIGRMPENDLRITNPTVSAYHARLFRDAHGAWNIMDLGSSNGTRVDSMFLSGPKMLAAGSVLALGNAQMVFLETSLLVMVERRGVEVVAKDLVRYRVNKGTRRITTDHISLTFGRGEFVAIVGGSGCGKSTLLNELNGSEPADEGSVTLDGTDLYTNFESLKCSIGYVPQQDIVYDELRLSDMLHYAAKLRMQPDTRPEERERRVNEVIDLLELGFVRDNVIGRLSGGQKKRASIAVELLADPRLLFLDEPTSGLDPGIERKLMVRLAEMAHEGRTIILVTHTTLNLHLCDKVVFLGKGGKLCYVGNPQGALAFFNVDDYVEVYPLIEERPDYWTREFHIAQFQQKNQYQQQLGAGGIVQGKHTPGFFSQLGSLTARYAKLLLNDRSRLALMIGQAPLLAILINIVADPGVFEICEDTKFCLFALSCAAFWVGIFDSIQEICKEQSIFKRECDGGMRLTAYIASKVIVLGALCLIQTLLLVGMLLFCMGIPQNPLFSAPIELMISTYLTVLSAMCLGLLVSAFFRSPERALAVAPLLILPQILFSGIVFDLNDVTEIISYGINCRWAIEAMGTTADLNGLDLTIYGEEITVPPERRTLENQTVEVPAMTEEVDLGDPIGIKEVDIPAKERTFDSLEVDVPETTMKVDADMLEHEEDEMFEHTFEHLLRNWGILIAFSAIGIIGCLVLLALQIRH